jgi:hypothetical protein
MMNKLLLCFLLFSFVANAQAKKSTKEKAIHYIEKTINDEVEFSEFEIKGDTISWNENGENIYIYRSFKNVKFDKISDFEVSHASDKNENIIIKFSVNTIKFHTKGIINEEAFDNQHDDVDKIEIVVPSDKVQSIIKTFERLKEITIKENSVQK